MPTPSDKTLAMRPLEGKKVADTALRYDPDVYVSAVEVAEAVGCRRAGLQTLVTQPETGNRFWLSSRSG